MIIDSAKYTNPGGHEINEDSYLCRGDKGIFIVADGLGGHSSGEKASQTAIAYFEKNCVGGYTGEGINALMEGANTQVLQNGDGGKTTVAAAFVENGNFIYANAGDSRVYYFRDGKIIAQTKDHSVCQASVDMGMMRPEDIRGSEDRSRLLKVLGGEENLAIKKHYQPIRVQAGDAFLVCSDGFWDYVYETEMEADLLKSGSADVWLKYMLKRHILRAQNKGDNYTAICGIIHTEEGDVFGDFPAGSRPGAEAGQKKFPVKAVIIGAAAVLLAAAAVVFGILFFGGNGGEQPDTSSTPVETPEELTSSTTPDTTPQESSSDTADTADTADKTEETSDTADETGTEATSGDTAAEETSGETGTSEDTGDVTTQEPEETVEETTEAVTAPEDETEPVEAAGDDEA